MSSQISSAYSLANGCGLLVSGRLADLYGRKWLYLLGMAAFLILNVISGVVRVSLGDNFLLSQVIMTCIELYRYMCSSCLRWPCYICCIACRVRYHRCYFRQ